MAKEPENRESDDDRDEAQIARDVVERAIGEPLVQEDGPSGKNGDQAPPKTD